MDRAFILGLIFVFAFAPCCKEGAKAVMIVKEENVDALGELTFSRGQSGMFEPQIVAPGYIVVFRADNMLGKTAGKAGEAYRIQKDLSLKFIRHVDLKKSDKEIAAEFGVKTE